MRDAERFIEEMRRFFGLAEEFHRVPTYMARRAVGTLQLMEHQEEALNWLASERQAGRSTFLIELPTGTGKTEVFIEDFRRQKQLDRFLNGLIVVPTTRLGCAAEVRVPAADEALLSSCANSRAPKPAGDAAGQESHTGAGQQQPAAKAKRPLLKLLEILDQFPPNPDWPEDAAAQHDHYLYGTPKRPNP